MDPVTHGLVGACAAQLVSPRDKQREAAFAGFVAALLPDLDVLLRSSHDPLFQLELHRQFSHSFLFIPVGALLASGLLWLLLRKRLLFRQLYLMCFCAYGTAGLLDACTSYGTQLLWPFSTFRFAWNLTPVVEPLLTLCLLVLLAISLKWKQKRWPALAAGSLVLFLLHGGVHQKQALRTARDLALSRGHEVEHFVVKPTLGNQVLWRVNYIFEGRLYADGVRSSLWAPSILYEGESAPLVVVEDDFSELKGTALYHSLQRFARLSEGYLVRHPEQPNVMGDARYSMLATSLKPLWGLEIDPEQPQKPLQFLTFRDSSSHVREEFWKMWRGKK